MDEEIAAWLFDRHMQRWGVKPKPLAAEDDDIRAAWLVEARLLLELPGFHKLRALAMKWDAQANGNTADVVEVAVKHLRREHSAELWALLPNNRGHNMTDDE